MDRVSHSIIIILLSSRENILSKYLANKVKLRLIKLTHFMYLRFAGRGQLNAGCNTADTGKFRRHLRLRLMRGSVVTLVTFKLSATAPGHIFLRLLPSSSKQEKSASSDKCYSGHAANHTTSNCACVCGMGTGTGTGTGTGCCRSASTRWACTGGG